MRSFLLLLRHLRDKSQQRSVLIQINDNGPRELLRFRWQAALRLRATAGVAAGGGGDCGAGVEGFLQQESR